MNRHRLYKRPPVTESAIELRFERPVSQSDLRRTASRLQTEYPISEDVLAQNVNIDQQAQAATFSTAWQGVKLSSADRTDVLFFQPGTLVVGHLAPHKGWNHIMDNLKNAWLALRRATGENLALSRVGVRYINRIDILAKNGKQPLFSDYIRLYPQTPSDLATTELISEFSSHVVYPIPETELTARLVVASIISPLIAHNSILFDVDIYTDHVLPRKLDDLWQLLDLIRDHKNTIFETCITDNSRELFDR